MKNFWQQLNKPFYALAPMAGITDSAFRQMSKRFGADVVYSELASVTALVYDAKKTLELLEYDEIERPYVVQLFGSDPKHFEIAVKIVEQEIKPDGIDINFGCPVPKVMKQGAGAALFTNLKLSRQVIERTVQSTSLPVSIKTRSEAKGVGILKFLDTMSGLDVKAIMIHGRTLAQGFSGPVDFAAIKKARDYFGGTIIANGGIASAQDAQRALDESGADGVGIGQGAMGRPWIFSELPSPSEGEGRVRLVGKEPEAEESEAANIVSIIPNNKKEIFNIAHAHAELAFKLKGKQGILEMRKHLCWYVRGLPEASRLRQAFVQVESLDEIKNILKEKSGTH